MTTRQRPDLPARILLRALLVVVLGLISSCGAPESSDDQAEYGLVVTPFTERIGRYLEPVSDDSYGFDASESLFQHFGRLGNITFTDSVLIGSITRLDVLDDGRFVVLDRQSAEVHLLDASGRHLGMLDARDCDPGADWRPMNVIVLDDDSIVVTGLSTPRPARFQADGSCAGFVDLDTYGTSAMIGAGPEHIHTMDLTPDGYSFALRTLDGAVVRRFGASSQFANFLMRMRSFDQLAQGPNGALIVGLGPFAAPMIFKGADAEGQPLFDPPAYVRPMTDDMQAGVTGDPGTIFDAIAQVRGNRTTIDGVYRISNEATLVRYRNHFRDMTDVDAYGLHIVRDDGHVLTPEPVYHSRGHAPHYRGFSPLAVKDNLLFTLRPAREKPDGDWGNPGLTVWRF